MSVTTGVEIKSLQTQLAKLKVKRESAIGEQRSICKTIDDFQKEIVSIEGKIASLQKKTKQLIISEHAILRYLERVKGIDLEQIRSEMILPKMKVAMEQFKDGTFSGPNNCKLVVKDNTVVTILTKEEE